MDIIYIYNTKLIGKKKQQQLPSFWFYLFYKIVFINSVKNIFF